MPTAHISKRQREAHHHIGREPKQAEIHFRYPQRDKGSGQIDGEHAQKNDRAHDARRQGVTGGLPHALQGTSSSMNSMAMIMMVRVS